MDIKFRGKRLDNGEWVYGSLISDLYIVGDVVEWNDEYFNTEWWSAVDPNTVGQYTGLMDCNEKEIYVGDIRKHDHANFVFVVEYDNALLSYIARYPNGGFDYMSDIGEDSTLIGNIHDNPELLEATT